MKKLHWKKKKKSEIEKHRRKSLRYYHEDGGRERAYSQLTTEEIGAIVDETRRRRLEQTKEKFLTHVELQQLKGQIPKPVDAETQRIVEMVGTHTLSDECMNKVCCIV